jgi:hypothetical protein
VVLPAHVEESSAEPLEGTEPTSEDCALESPKNVPGSVEITTAVNCIEEIVQDSQSQSAENVQLDFTHVARNDGSFVEALSLIRPLADKNLLPVESECVVQII